MSDLINLDTAEGQVPDYMRRASEFIYDPQAIQRMAIGHVEDILEGRTRITDATNPMVTLMGVSAANASAVVLSNATQLRKRYPALASSEDDLYNHMSDKDYVGRFATPHKQKVLCLVSLAELKSKLVDQADGSRLAVIPRYTNVTVDGIVFSLLYPVEVRELAHGGMSVHYDLDQAHPLHPLASSIIYWTIRDTKAADTQFLQMELEMLQVGTSIYTFDLNPTQGLFKTVDLNDAYSTARVWFKGGGMTEWKEIATTHSDMTYDATKPTALLKVVGSKLSVRVPQIYFTTNQISGKLRLDVFTTRGPIFLNTENKGIDNFQSVWGIEVGEPTTAAMAAWQGVLNKFLLFQNVASGGTAALPFEQLRNNVINNAVGPQVIPITPAQRNSALQRNGYSLRQFVDAVTTRQILAAKPLPSSRDKALITPGSATIASVLTTTSALKNSAWVADNGQRITITDNALWQLRAGVVRMVTQDELTALMGLDSESRIAAINAGAFLYSPFYYVLDSSQDRFAARAYHLNAPTAVIDKYVGDNPSTQMQIEINEMVLINTGNGWQLRVSVLSNAAWKEQDISYRHAQLSFEPSGIGASAAVNATATVDTASGEDVFTFSLPSGYDIDANHKVSHIGFHAITDAPRQVFSDLVQQMRLTFASSAPMPSDVQVSAIDNTLVRVSLPVRLSAVASQMVTLSFGRHLKNLWSASRTLAAAQPWQTYTADVPAVYAKNVYEINPLNNTEVFLDATGKPFFKKIASAGDVIKENGEIVYAQRAGQVIFASGKPVPVSADSLMRQFDMLFLEGCYYFATDASTTQYTNEMVQVLASYILDDLPQFEDRVIENTDIYFYPQVTLGSVTVLIDAGLITQMQADQRLTVRLGVHERIFDNDPLRTQLESKTIQTIQAFFTNEQLSVSELINQLRAAYAGDVASIQVSGLGGANNASAVTLLNTNERLSLKKEVFILDSGEFTVREAVTVDFFKHDVNA